MYKKSGRYIKEKFAFFLLRLASGINIAALCGILGFVIYNGLPAISWEFLTSPPKKAMTAGGIWPCIWGSLLLSLGALVISFPLGVCSAIYLREYAKKGHFAQFVRLGINNLAGVPSIIFGLFGLSFFVISLGFGISLLSGILTLTVLTLPIIISTAEEALRQIPVCLHEASYALGATKSQTIFYVLLPAALPGMLTGAILGLARAAGETAAIMFTAVVFFSPKVADSILSPVMALSNHMYVLASSGTDIDKTLPLQYGTALTLVSLVLGMNLTAIFLRDHLQRKHLR